MSNNTTENKKEIGSKLADLTGPSPTGADLERVIDKLRTARIGMLLRASFFGNLATRLKLVPADEWLTTAATDGRHFYFNSKFVEMLRPRELEFLFGHEVLHCVYDHFGRKGDRDHQLWNISNDYCVNSDLKKHKVGEMITTVDCLYDPKYDGMSSEEIYDKLYESAEKIDIDQMIEKMIDEHLDQDDPNGPSKGNGDSDDSDSNGKGPVAISAEERQKIRDEIKEAMLNAAQTSEAGNIPAGVKRMIQELTEPKMDWRQILRQQIEATIKHDYTWQRMSRKGWDIDAIMPGMNTTDAIDIVLAIDTSGSISHQMLRDFLSEIKGITEQFDQFRIHLFTFDTKVYNPCVYESDNMDDLLDYDIQGGGGTDFDVIWNYLKEEQIEPKKLVVLTDGYPWNSWGDPNYCDTVFVIHGDIQKTIEAPFGITTHYEEQAETARAA